MDMKLLRSAATALVVGLLAGCGGGGDGGGDSGGSVTPTPPPVVGPTPAPVPTGTSPINVANLTPEQFAALQITAVVGGAVVNSPPQISFALQDQNANPIIGWGVTNQTATATLPSQAWLRFSLAKLVPGTNGSPSKWVNYIVTTVPTYKSATDKTIVPPAPRTPTADREGTLVDNKNGTYVYTFARDVTKATEVVNATTAPGLGDVKFEPTLTHRMTIQISGDARGTGSNTATGAASGVTAVPLENPLNVIHDFIPSTGKKVASTDFQREVISKTVCNECHEKLTLHGSRNETQYCVVCHNDQLRYGQTNVASTPDTATNVPLFPKLTETKTVSATTGITSYSYSPSMMIADNVVIADFPVMVHRIHGGRELVKENYNLANVVFDLKGYSMLGGGQRMCTKCHDNTKVAQADNYKNKPSRLACGGCHDGIKWEDGTGSTLADKAADSAAKATSTLKLATSGHVGKGQSSDQACSLCHTAADIPVYHRTENITTHNPTIATGLKTFTYEIKSADVNASNDLAIVFKISADGTPVKFKAAAAGLADPLDGFTGSPSFLLAYAMTQDGVTTPTDYNNVGVAQAQAISMSIANLLNTSHANAANQSVTGPDASGYYTATLKGAGSTKFPVGAKMRAVGLNGYFTQISPAAARHTISFVKAVTGDAVRRTVVDKTKCANCHEWFEGHGGNRVYETQICVMCHVPGLATSGRGIPDSTMNTWVFNPDDTKTAAEWKTVYGFDKTSTQAALKLPVTTNNFKDMIHGIHAGRERVTPFTDARDSTSRGAITILDFRRMDFPGRLNNCETCHVAGTYSNVPASSLASVYEIRDSAYDAAIAGGTATTVLAKAALATTTGNATDVVTTPFTGACVSCHDSSGAQAHMKLMGGQIQVKRNTLNLAGESCVVCHGVGKDKDVVVVHK